MKNVKRQRSFLYFPARGSVLIFYIFVTFSAALPSCKKSGTPSQEIVSKTFSSNDDFVDHEPTEEQIINDRSSESQKRHSYYKPRLDLTSHVPEDKEEYRFLSRCKEVARSDLDGDGSLEEMCIREMRSRGHDTSVRYVSVIVDLYKNDDWLLRQELPLGHFWEERFELLEDIGGGCQTRIGDSCQACCGLFWV